MDKKKILEAKKSIDAAVKNLLSLLDKDVEVKNNRPVTERIKDFDDAVHELGYSNRLVLEYQNLKMQGFSKDIVAYARLRVIVKALNEGWEPQFKEDEKRYYPYYDLYTQEEIDQMNDTQRDQLLLWGGHANSGSRCGLACGGSYYAFSLSSADCGARLVLKTKNLDHSY
jgi:hypothetical protein